MGSALSCLLGSPLTWPAVGVLIALCVALADMAWRRVPNALALQATCFGVVVQHGAHALADGLLVAAGVFVLLVLAYAAGMVGAADAKVGFGFALMVGPAHTLAFLLASCVALLVLSGAVLWQRPRATWREVFGGAADESLLGRARRERRTLPLTVCFSAGAMWASQGGMLWQL